MAGAQSVDSSKQISNWFTSPKTDTPQETELEKLKRGNVWSYAASQGAGAGMI